MYQLVIMKPAKKFIDKLPANEQRRVMDAIKSLPDRGDIQPLSGHEDLFRLRVGKYCVIYSVDNGQFLILIVDDDSQGQIYNRY